LGQALSERDEVVVFGLIAQRSPARVVAILLATARVDAGGQQVAALALTDPDVAPGGR
jgi:hypothetical protein